MSLWGRRVIGVLLAFLAAFLLLLTWMMLFWDGTVTIVDYGFGNRIGTPMELLHQVVPRFATGVIVLAWFVALAMIYQPFKTYSWFVVLALTTVLLFATFWEPIVLWLPVLVPGTAFLYLLGLLPDRLTTWLAYAIDPDGGPVAGVGVVLLGAVLFWATVLGVWIWRRRAHAQRPVGLRTG